MQTNITNNHLHALVMLERSFEWLVAIAATIAVFPGVLQLFKYILGLIYELFVQYQYLF